MTPVDAALFWETTQHAAYIEHILCGWPITPYASSSDWLVVGAACYYCLFVKIFWSGRMNGKSSASKRAPWKSHRRSIFFPMAVNKQRKQRHSGVRFASWVSNRRREKRWGFCENMRRGGGGAAASSGEISSTTVVVVGRSVRLHSFVHVWFLETLNGWM